jgi:hypothetical protein
MGTAARLLGAGAGVSLLVVALVGQALVALGVAQDQIRIDGTVLWLSGNSLTLALDAPVSPTQYAIGPYLVPGRQRPTVNVDLTHVPQSDYAYMRPGERVGVIGAASRERRRFMGTRSSATPSCRGP